MRIPAGASTVEFRYEPLSWRIGWITSVVALLALVAVLAVGLRRRGGAAPGAPPPQAAARVAEPAEPAQVRD